MHVEIMMLPLRPKLKLSNGRIAQIEAVEGWWLGELASWPAAPPTTGFD